MVPLSIVWSSFNERLKEDIVLTPPKLGSLEKTVVCVISSFVFVATPFHSWEGVAAKTAIIAVAAFFLSPPREIILYTNEKVWNPPLEKAFMIEGLSSFSSEIIKLVIIVTEGNERSPEEMEKIAQFVLKKREALKGLFLEKHPHLNHPETLPSIEFTATVLAIQSDFENCFSPGKLIKNLQAEGHFCQLNQEIKSAQYHFLKALDWNLNLTGWA